MHIGVPDLIGSGIDDLGLLLVLDSPVPGGRVIQRDEGGGVKVLHIYVASLIGADFFLEGVSIFTHALFRDIILIEVDLIKVVRDLRVLFERVEILLGQGVILLLILGFILWKVG